MPTTNDIFNSVIPEVEEGDYITIDPITRELSVPYSQYLFGVYQDKDAERKYFKCPRYVGDNIDLTSCQIFINYLSSAGNYGQYMCEDIAASGESDITFSWLLSNNLFDSNEESRVTFAVQVKRLTENGTYERVFNTRPATGTSFATIESTEAIQRDYPDVIMQMLNRIANLETKVRALGG